MPPHPLVNVTVLARPPVAWALLTLVMTTGSYYALLFTLSQYLQTGLGDSALVSGLILVPWVAAFGLAGQVARRLPARTAPMVPAAGCLLLAVAYLAISAALLAGQHGNLLLTVLLGTGGLGLGLQFSTLISYLTTTVPDDYAPDISGVATTAMQIGGALSVAAIAHPGAGHATHAYAITTVFLGAIALIAILTARLAIRRTPA
jgi:MFS family permease